MELNHKCIRDVLLAAEEMCCYDSGLINKRISLEDFLKNDRLKSYTREDVFYSIQRLGEGNYLEYSHKYSSGGLYLCFVHNLTLSGHEYLESIRNSKVFDTVMDKVNEIDGGATIEIVKAIAIKKMKELFDI